MPLTPEENPARDTAVRDTAVRTRRLDLTPLAVADADEMSEVLADPALHLFIGGAPLSRAELLARYGRLAAGSPDPATVWANWTVRLRSDGRAAGTVQATVTDGGRTAEIAWVIGTPWQGRGFAVEAATGLVGLLADRGVRTVLAHVHPDHAASAAVARAAGLTSTGEEEDGEIRWELRLPGAAV